MSRADDLKEAHKLLEQELKFLVNKHPHVQESRVKEIKKQKLVIKDELERLKTPPL
jgi:hypothetical protein